MKHLSCLLLFLSLIPRANAQNYTRSIGIGGNNGICIAYRQFYDDKKATEGMVGISKDGLKVILLREYLQPFKYLRSENFKLIYGFGMHVGVIYTNKYTFLFRTYYDEWKLSPQLGIDGLVGFEYTMPEFPLSMRLAAQPYFEYSLNRYFQVKALNLYVLLAYRF